MTDRIEPTVSTTDQKTIPHKVQKKETYRQIMARITESKKSDEEMLEQNIIRSIGGGKFEKIQKI